MSGRNPLKYRSEKGWQHDYDDCNIKMCERICEATRIPLFKKLVGSKLALDSEITCREQYALLFTTREGVWLNDYDRVIKRFNVMLIIKKYDLWNLLPTGIWLLTNWYLSHVIVHEMCNNSLFWMLERLGYLTDQTYACSLDTRVTKSIVNQSKMLQKYLWSSVWSYSFAWYFELWRVRKSQPAGHKKNASDWQ